MLNPEPGHVGKFTAFTAETFGGPDRFSKEIGGFQHFIKAYRGYNITEEQLQRFVDLFLKAADKANLPKDNFFWETLKSQVVFSSHVATQNFNAKEFHRKLEGTVKRSKKLFRLVFDYSLAPLNA